MLKRISNSFLWGSIGLAHRISEDITAVFAKVNGRLMGGMINYCGYFRRHAFGKQAHTHTQNSKMRFVSDLPVKSLLESRM